LKLGVDAGTGRVSLGQLSDLLLHLGERHSDARRQPRFVGAEALDALHDAGEVIEAHEGVRRPIDPR
jgi:hypothetical protein